MKRSADSIESTSDAKRTGNIHRPYLTSCNLHKSSELNVHPSEFVGRFPYFRQPREIASFSLDKKRTFHYDRSHLKVYVAPPSARNVAFDLRVGYGCFIKRDEMKKEYLDELLRCILLSSEKFRPNTAALDQDNINMT